MTHLNEGLLRRMQDEPNSSSAADSAHFAACAHCRARAEAMAAEARGVSALLAVPDARVEAAVALLRVRRLAADQAPRPGLAWLQRVRRGRAFRPVAATVVALGLVLGLMATGVAEKAVDVFRPTTFAVVSVDPATLGALPDLSQFGAYTMAQEPKFSTLKSPAEALAGAGMSALLAPSGGLPATVKGLPTYATFTRAQGTFTFSAAKAAQYARTQGKPLPPMGKGLDGTTISATAGPGILTIYGAAAGVSETTAPAEGAPAKRHLPAGLSIPSLAIVQMTSPTVVSDGASVQAVEGYLAGLPGVPPELAAQIQALGQPTSTLPVPVPTGQGSHPVDIPAADGSKSKGLFVGDSTGLGSGVIWQRDGMLYAVVGTLTEDQVVAIAGSLR